MAGAAAAMAGTLRIRPVLTMRGGEPALHSRARTRSRAIDDAVDLVAGPAEAAAVFHTGAPEARDAALRVGRIAGSEPLIAGAGQVTGTHLGPPVLGLVTAGRVAGASP
jgi:fatty acid-binding protein DegV